MYDKILAVYKQMLRNFAGIALFFLFLLLIVGAFWFGLAYDFGCFGKGASCDNAIPNAFVIFPFFVMLLGGWLYVRWRRWRRSQYRRGVEDDVLRELGQSPVAPSEQRRHTITALLEDYGSLSLVDLQVKSGLPKDDLLMSVKELMQDNIIRQTTDIEKGAYFSLTIPPSSSDE